MNSETLRAVKTVYIHGGGCPDGIASAILLHDALPDAKVVFIQYNSEAHINLPIEPNVLFADFTPKEEQVKAWVEAGAIVLDHHKGAKDIVAAFETNGRFGDEETEPGVCGAVLCYRHVWQPVMAEHHAALPERMQDMSSFHVMNQNADYFARLAGVRDTWQRQSPEWGLACEQAEMLRFFPENHWLDLVRPFSQANQALWAERRALGKLLIEKHGKSVARTLEKAWRHTTAKGTRVTVFEGTGQTSDASDVVQDTDLVIGFSFHVEADAQKMVFSTRTRMGYDCLGLAKRFGGGGHSSAAGFSQVITGVAINPYQLVEKLVEDFEREANIPAKTPLDKIDEKIG